MKNILKFFILALIIFNSNTVQAQNVSSQIDDEQAHNIVLNGTPDDVKMLLQSGYDVNRVYLCLTPLIMAIKSASNGKNARIYPSYALEKIKILMNEGADVNFVPCSGESMPALHWAVSLPSGLQDMEYDVNKAIDERIKNKIGECNFPGVVTKPCGEVTPEERKKITIAIQGAMKLAYDTFTPYFMEIIEFLVNQGGDINLKSGTLSSAPIHIAASNPQEITLEPLKYLIEKGTDINTRDIDGNTPLFWAYGSGNDGAVKLLIEAGADKNVKNKENVYYNAVGAWKIRGFMDNDGNVMFEEL